MLRTIFEIGPFAINSYGLMLALAFFAAIWYVHRRSKAENLPFDDSAFDAIFLYNSFHHIDKREKTVKECMRVTNSAGIICIIEFNENGIEMLRKIHPGHPRMACVLWVVSDDSTNLGSIATDRCQGSALSPFLKGVNLLTPPRPASTKSLFSNIEKPFLSLEPQGFESLKNIYSHPRSKTPSATMIYMISLFLSF